MILFHRMISISQLLMIELGERLFQKFKTGWFPCFIFVMLKFYLGKYLWYFFNWPSLLAHRWQFVGWVGKWLDWEWYSWQIVGKWFGNGRYSDPIDLERIWIGFWSEDDWTIVGPFLANGPLAKGTEGGYFLLWKDN